MTPFPFVGVSTRFSRAGLVGDGAWLVAFTNPLMSAADPTAGLSSGRVLHEATGSYLEEATVSLEREGRTALTSLTGFCGFPGVAPEEYAVEVGSTGFDAQTVGIAVAAGQTGDREIDLPAHTPPLAGDRLAAP